MMKKSIYVQLMLIFIGVFVLSNILSSVFTGLNTEQNLKIQIKSQLTNGVETAKEVYEKEKINKESLEKLFKDNYITIKVIDSIEKYHLNEETLYSLEKGNTAIFHGNDHKRFAFTMPIALVKTGDSYIVGELKINNLGFNIRHYTVTTNIISIIIGSILFLIVGKMIVKPIRKLTKATERVAAGDFNIDLDNHRQDELGTLISSFNTMAKELKTIEILRNDFISDISHEFKTPLTSIEGYTKLLNICDEEEREEYIDIITEETKRLSTLATNILTLNKIENENTSIYMEEFSMDEQIRKAILLLENKWCEKDIELEIDLETIEYKGNQNLMYQVWLNLIDNAIKFSPKGQIVEIKLYKQKDKVIFFIKDNGIGIPKEKGNRIFEKFYKEDKSRNTEGNGLGLSIVKKIVDMHQGKIYLDFEIDRGIKIIVEL